jgi:hypothetical protein
MISDLKNRVKELILRPIKAVEFSEPIWKLYNASAINLHKTHPPRLNNIQQNILDGLHKDGIATVHISELLGNEASIYDDILKRLDDLVGNAKQDPKKPHFYNLWDTRLFPLDYKNGFTQLALSPTVIDIVNCYMGMWTRLLLSNAYVGKITQEGLRINTQNWHRDMHDRKLVMVFLYLTDVLDEGSGPFWYIKGSHIRHDWNKLFPPLVPFAKGKQTFSEAEIVAKIPSEYHELILGKRGTLIFADTRGLHRGGHCTTNERIISVCGYSSNHRFTKSKRFSDPTEMVGKNKMPDQVSYALYLERRGK